MAGPTTLKLGYTQPLNDAYGAHPVLGGPLDLNDGVNFTLVSPDGLELAAPTRTLVPTGNLRAQGERIVRAVYRHNRAATVRLIVGPAASYSAFVANVRALQAWVQLAPVSPVTIQWQPPNAAHPVYLDVVGAALDISTDEGEWLRLQLEPIELVFIVRPGLRGDRVVLDNLLTNPGFGQGSAAPVVAFTDTFANAQAYTLNAGSAPGVASNIMTMAANSRVLFGSPGWGAISAWQVRFQFSASLNAVFYLHYTDANDWLAVSITGATLQLIQRVAGTSHTLASVGSLGLVVGNWYWVVCGQYPVPVAPTPTNNPPAVYASLYNDTGPGSIGTQVQTTAGPVGTYDSVTALSGQPAIQANTAALALGGAFSNVHTVALFGPGSWIPTSVLGGSGATAPAAWAWELTPANVFKMTAGSPINGAGAARVDFPPAGTVSATLSQFTGGTPAGTAAMPAPSGDSLHASVWARSLSLSAAAAVSLNLREFDVNGTLLRVTTLATVAGSALNSASVWTQLSGSLTTGASTAYADLQLAASDLSVGGASAGATVWFDNAQVWDATKTPLPTGMASMPYCELRFAQTPAQLVLSGLQGDLAAPAHLAWGTYLASWTRGSTLSYWFGRRGGVSGGAQLVASGLGYYGAAFTPVGTPVLDPTSYGGYYVKASITNGNTWNPRAFSPLVADAAGVYHVLTRFRSADPSPASVQARVRCEEALDPWFVDTLGLGTLGIYYGPYQNPLATQNQWTVCDVGQVILPPFPKGALADPTQLYVTPRVEWNGAALTATEADCNWLALLPVDGSVLLGQVNNPSNSPVSAVTSSYLWMYVDGLLVNRAGMGQGASVGGGGAANGGVWPGLDGPSVAYSIEAQAVGNPAHGGGGPGTSGTGSINVNGGGDPYLVLDPTLQMSGPQGTPAAGSGGVNQIVAVIADGSADVLGVAAQVAYSPLYLWPR